MKETEYTYAVAYLKTLENKMLSRNDIDNLINANGVDECIKLLLDNGYGNDLSDNISVDEILSSELEKAWVEAKNVTPVDAPLDILLYQNDFHNLKTILKASVMGEEWEKLILKPCLTEPLEIFDAIKNKSYNDLPEFIKEATKNGYDIVTKTNDGQYLEIYLDRVLFEQMKKRCDDEKNDFLMGWVDLNILIANLKISIRAVGMDKEFIKEAIIPTEKFDYNGLIDAACLGIQKVKDKITLMGYSEAVEKLENSFQAFEKWCDDIKMQYIKKARMKCFGFEPILGFLIGKEFEIQALRIILAGKENNIDVDIIKERLRDLYV